MSNVTSSFIDLATFDDINKTIYNGLNSLYRKHDLVSWASVIPTYLRCLSDNVDFGKDIEFFVSRAGDYPIRLQLVFAIPQVRLKTRRMLERLRWTRNLAHNLIRSVSLVDGDRTIWRFDNLALDFINAFRGLDEEYYKLIGNIPELINPTSIHSENGIMLPATTIILPLNIKRSERDTSRYPYILPMAGLQKAEIKLKVCLRNWKELLIFDNFETGISRPAQDDDIVLENPLKVSCIADYALVSGAHRASMTRTVFDLIFDITETSTLNTVSKPYPSNSENITQLNHIDFGGMIHTLYFGVKNVTNRAEHSNYISILMIENGATNLCLAMEKACLYRHRELVLLLIEKGVSIDNCNMILEHEDIMRLVKAGVEYFGKYRNIACDCNRIIEEVEHVLDDLNIFPEFSKLVNSY